MSAPAQKSGMRAFQNFHEQDWLIDIILGFFTSPEWKTPVLSFIDEHCLIFDSEDENKFEFTTIHTEFKKLVEGLIEHMLQEAGATPELFAEVCEKGRHTQRFRRIH